MLAELFIGRSIKERNKQRVTQESLKKISEEITNQINKKHFYQWQKGRKLSMFVASIEVYKGSIQNKKRISSL